MDHIHNHTKAIQRSPVPRQDNLLEQYYDRLHEWALLLTRGDVAKAQDIVHELCLHLTLSAPDLSTVQNLDGYLYTCLRHIFLSDIARSAREALYSLGPDDFDSIQIAFRSPSSGDPLQQQNDLRRICTYVTWRKAQAKSASYFILRFLHGYYRREVATIAGVPLSSIDPKLNKVRSEVHLYLAAPGKLQFTSRELPPNPRLHWTPLSSLAIFKELRETVLAAREGECLPEDDLLAHYQNSRPTAISCSLLSHLVSCERCLSLVDQHFRRPTLKDREPLDSLSASSDAHDPDAQGAHTLSREAMFRSVRRHGSEILDHRPRTLSIAVDGKILASRDVQSEKSMLSARIERPENTSFIEVFSEQGIRLALLSLFELPPDGPHQRLQRVSLSDDRWLELTLTFDGLGLNSEVTYFDPSLAIQAIEEDDASDPLVLHRIDPPQEQTNVMSWPGASSFLAIIRRFFRPVTPSPVIAWSLVLACVFCVAGYLMYRHKQPVTPALNARQVLNRSIQIEAASLEGRTEHQVLRFEEASLDGNILNQGTIDLWRDGGGIRHMRRLYDAQHRLVAAEWMQRNGGRGQYPQAEDAQPSAADRELLADDLWKQDVTPVAFQELNGDNAEIRSTEDGFALIVEPGASHPQLLSATLVLDGHFHPIREVMRVRSGNDVREVCFVQADYERRPSASVPDAIFDPYDQGLRSKVDRQLIFPKSVASDVQLTELHVAVLYQLNILNADTSDPIEVERTSDGHIRVTGMVADDDRKQEIESRLNLLDNHQFLQTQLVSQGALQKHGKKAPRPLPGAVSMYDVGQTRPPADALLRTYFQGQGLSQEPLDAAVSGFSREALGHAQRALQNASALKRLSDTFSASELRSVSLASQQQWTGMVAKHAAALEVELRALRGQLSQLSPSPEQFRSVTATADLIGTPAHFARAADQLLVDTKNLDQSVSGVFASSQSPDAQPADIQSLIVATSNAIPLQKAVEMTSFAVQLNAASNKPGRTAAMNRQHSRPETQTPDRP
jgi:DNA-directed RNA polymerase specialized sigma24 family protein